MALMVTPWGASMLWIKFEKQGYKVHVAGLTRPGLGLCSGILRSYARFSAGLGFGLGFGLGWGRWALAGPGWALG